MGKKHRTRRPVHAVKKSRFSWNYFGLLVFLIGFSLFHLYMRNNIRSMLMEMNQAQKQVNNLIQENRRLQARMFSLSSNSRIRRIAIDVLHMKELTRPPKIVYFKVDDSRKRPELLAEVLSPESIAYKNPNSLIIKR